VTLIKRNPTALKSWKSLESNFKNHAQKKITDYFSEDADRIKKLSLQWESFYVDYSKNLLDEKTLSLLTEMAKESGSLFQRSQDQRNRKSSRTSHRTKTAQSH
jgi:glucose-6-phosphate isomerase